MRPTTYASALCLLLGVAWACGDGRPPTAPKPPVVPVPKELLAGINARGFVSDTAFRPLSGVRVEVLDGPTAGSFTLSGTDGWFTSNVLLDRPFTVRATKAGYIDTVFASSTYTTEFGIFFHGYVSLPSTDTPAVFQPGGYQVTLDFPCTGIPAGLRTQAFPATVTARPDTPPGTNFNVTIDDASFNTPFNFRTFEFGVSGIAVGVRIDVDLWWEVPPLQYFDVVIAGPVGTVPPGQPATFSTQVKLNYCELNAPKGVASPNDNCQTIPASQVVTREFCASGRMTLAPR